MKYRKNKPAIVVLAAGAGKRMKSSKAKVLHDILGIPMVLYVVKTAQKVAGKNVILVVGNQAEAVRKVVSEQYDVIFSLQKEQLGTGHAVSCALPYIPESTQHVIVLCGDVPLLTPGTIHRLLDDHITAKRDITILATEIDDPKGYGRILMDKERNVTGIVEETDATDKQKEIKIINTGIYCLKKEVLFDSLQKITPNNVQGEYYLTDIIEISYNEQKIVGAVIEKDFEEFIGVNSHNDLMIVANIMRKRQRPDIS
ncbi:MAG: NTP transferase domain-containing protein [Desulfobacterales bacterium]|nr:MAG: NTP transferase domain-containing protein [Desulfobacterales bacterium]